MTDKIKSVIDAVTDAVFSYRPKDKGKQAKKPKQHLPSTKLSKESIQCLEMTSSRT